MAATESADPASDPSAFATRTDLGDALTILRDRANLTVEFVAKEVGMPTSTVGDYFAGQSLPHAANASVIPNILRVVGVNDPDQISAWQEAVKRLRRLPSRRRSATTAPFRGLPPFDEEHAEWFFGREDLVRRLVARVHGNEADRPIFVIGPSGAGKSSVLRAGLMPALEDVHVELVTPGPDPLAALDDALAFAGDGDQVLIVDQFEELFAPGIPADDRAEFIARVIETAREQVVVLGVRADFHGEIARYGELVPALEQALVIGPMTTGQLRDAITQPARKAGLALEPGLVELLIHEVSPEHDSGRLPLMSHALRVMWDNHLERNRMTVADYQATGGLQTAVAQSADKVFENLNPEQQGLARRLFLRLVHLEGPVASTRRKVSHVELTDGRHDAALTEVLDQFIDKRLLTADADGVVITHEALIREWPLLRKRIDADRAGLRVHRQLSASAREWSEGGRDSGALLRGGPLENAEAWKDEHADDLNAGEREFLSASIDQRKSEQDARRRQVRNLRVFAFVLVILVLAAGVLAWVLRDQSARAQHDRDLAASRDLATRSLLLRASDRSVAAQLALAAYRIAPTPEARASLLDISGEPAVTRMVGTDEVLQAGAVTHGGKVLAVAGTDKTIRFWDIADRAHPRQVGTPLAGPTDTVFALAFSPDGRVLAAGGADHQIRLWDVSDLAHPKAMSTLTQPTNTVYSVVFSSDGKLLAAGSADKTVRLWSFADPVHPVPLGGPLTGTNDYVQSVALAGNLIAAGTADQQVLLWDIADPAHPKRIGQPLTGPGGAILTVALSADGRRLAAGSKDRLVWLWNLANPRHPVADAAPLQGATGWVNAVTFSPAGDQLAVGGSDNQLRVWDLAAHKVIQALPHPGPVTAAGFLDGDRTIFTAAADGTTRLWSLPGGAITDPANSVFGVAYPAHGHLLAVSSGRAEDSVELWDTSDAQQPRRLSGSITSPPGTAPFSGAVALDQSGRLLITGCRDGAVQLWDVSNPAQPRLISNLPGDNALTESFAVSPNGRTLAVAGDDHLVRMWDITDPTAVRALPSLAGPANYVFNVAFSPDGTIVAAASADTKVWLWNVRDPRHPASLASLSGFRGYAYGVAFSPNAPVLAAGSGDRTVRLWNVADPAHPRTIGPPITGPGSYVYGIAISPDGSTLAIGSTDSSVRLVDITDPADPKELAAMTASADSVFTVLFSPDGTRLAAGTAERRVRFWVINPEATAARICATAGSGLTEAEWKRYVPDRPFTPPCMSR